MKVFTVVIDGRERTVEIDEHGSVNIVDLAGNPEVRRVGEGEYSVLIEGRSVNVVAVRNRDGISVWAAGEYMTAQVESERSRLLKQFARSTGPAHSKREILAPMPALVVRILVDPGQAVAAGQGLLVLEAMKMENEIKAPQAGTVKQIHVLAGKPVDKGELLLSLE